MDTVKLRQIEFKATYTFTYSGVLSPEITGARLYNDTGADRKIQLVRASLGTPPTGGPVIVDVLKNGTSIFGPHEFLAMDIPVGTHTVIQGPNDNYIDPREPSLWLKDEYLTVSILQIGSDFPGEDLTINVVVSE